MYFPDNITSFISSN